MLIIKYISQMFNYYTYEKLQKQKKDEEAERSKKFGETRDRKGKLWFNIISKKQKAC
jgi:hypothetical protein